MAGFNFGAFASGLNRGKTNPYLDILKTAQGLGETSYQNPPGINEAPPPPAIPSDMGRWLMEQGQTRGPVVAPEVPSISAPTAEVDGGNINVSGLDPIQHKGMFGVKGTLRDILGVLGDAFLVQSGNKSLYSPRREMEKQSDILAGKYQDNTEENFANNPALAIQRMAEAGYGDVAREMQDQYIKSEQLKAQQANAEARLGRQEARDEQLAKQGDILAQKNFIEGVLARSYSGIQDEKSLAQFNQWATAKLPGLGLEGYRLPTTLKEARQFGLNPYQRESLIDRDVGLGIQQQNANTNASRAAKERPRSDTSVELFQQISRIPKNKRTPEQQAFIINYTGQNKGGRRTGTIGVSGSDRPGEYNGQTRTSKKTGRTQTWDAKTKTWK